MQYSGLLKDPRWLHKREDILIIDKYKCFMCGCPFNLHVHHLKYTGKPWEAPDDDLVTLCRFHHDEIHSPIRNAQASIAV